MQPVTPTPQKQAPKSRRLLFAFTGLTGLDKRLILFRVAAVCASLTNFFSPVPNLASADCAYSFRDVAVLYKLYKS